MWTLVLIVVVVGVVAVVAMRMSSRPGPRHQPEVIDVDREPTPPGPEVTERMADPPPGSQADREDHGKP